MLLVVAAGVFEVEALRQVVVDLNGTQLPTAADGVLHHKVELRAIECSLALHGACLEAFFFASLDDGALGLFPVFVGTNIFLLVVRVAK